ncbi:hypothetical protein Cgig2_023305 [Carnegiea gigantea]|uniref:60S ribosomal protein L13 n=1 Tax=Carnegiea gigantea TaxID=171969 RepID=A0A9Q1GZD7_9CARY|nr:hypothetical protein Cgig2_023305 [Carnegiea gigantea]
MVRHNNVAPNGHFKKHRQNYVRTWFNQPARKTRRRNGSLTHLFIKPVFWVIIVLSFKFSARQLKAVKIFPRPTAGPLRPVVHGQTLKYNMKVRAGRGFSLEELQAPGTPKKLAPTIGIAVDHRRRNRSPESLQSNVQRLKTYMAKPAILLLRSWQPQPKSKGTTCQSFVRPPSIELVDVTDEMKSFNAYAKLRLERTNERHMGARLKRAAEAEKEDKK